MPSLTQTVEGFSFTSISAVGAQFRDSGLGQADIAPALGAAHALSPTRGLRLAKGLLATANTREQLLEDGDHIIEWARGGDAVAKRSAAQAFRQQAGRGGELIFVHKIASLPRADARAFMREHLDSGGDLGIVLDWLQMAGAELRRHPKRHDTAGFLGDVVDFVGDAFSTVGDAIVSVGEAVAEGVKGVVDAIVEAGRTIAEMAGAVLSWTVEKVADLVESLIEAGETVGSILAGALEAGLDALRKFTRAMIEAGRTLAELAAWALSQAAGVLADVFDAVVSTLADIRDLVVWAATQTAAAVRNVIEALIDIGQSVSRVLTAMLSAAADVLAAAVQALIEIGSTVGELLIAVITQPAGAMRSLMQALRQIGRSLVSLLDAARDAAASVLEAVVDAALAIGETVLDLMAWAATQVAEAARRVLDTMLRAGLRLIDVFASLAQATVSVMRKAVQAAFDLGRTFAGLVAELYDLATDVLADVIRAAIALGRTVVEFIGAVLEFTYAGAVKLMRAAMDAGIAVAELLGNVVAAGYFALRKIVNGILDAAGPLGDVLQWALDAAEDMVSEVWHDTLLAIRYAQEKITGALDWAVEKGREALGALLFAWESIGERLSDAYRHLAALARRVGDRVWDFLGWATFVLENSVDYLLNFLENDFIEGIAKVAEGLLRAGHALADLMVSIADESAQLVLEVVRGALRAGAVIGDLLIETLRQPDAFLDHVAAAIEALGNTIGDMFRAVQARGAAMIDALTLSLRRLGRSAQLILQGAAEIGGGLLGAVIAVLLSTLPSFRPLVAVERADAALVFGDTIDLDRVFISAEGPGNDVLFWVQDTLTGNPDSRAFVGLNLINFDIDDGIEIDDAGTIGLERWTFIHEMTHVWQGVTEGPVYIAHAIGLMPQGNAAYNYGYADGANVTLISDHKTPATQLVFANADGTLLGAGAETALQNGGGDITAFNVEQQGQIVMHWFARAHLSVPPMPTADWDPYIDAVRNAA
jgi:phage-related protein